MNDELTFFQADSDHNTLRNWLAETLRLTVFFDSADPVDPSTWWEAVTNEPPENSLFQSKASTLKQDGPFIDGRLILTVKPDRADWFFFPSFDLALNGPQFDQLQEYSSVIKLQTDFANKWFDVCPPVVRLAFGAILDLPVPNKNTGYNLLIPFLKSVHLDIDNSSDFLYQINRPRMSEKFPEIQINRLSKWSVQNVIISQVEVDSIKNRKPFQRTTDYFFARLELDINTVPGHSVFTSDELKLLFPELLKLANEIISRGDVA